MLKPKFQLKYSFPIIFFIVFFATGQVFAANKYWVGSVSSSTSKTENWSLTSGGTGGAGVPSSIDNIIFDVGSAGDAYFDTNIGFYQMDVLADFIYSISQNPNIRVSIGQEHISVSKSGTQIATTTATSTDQDLGGAFLLASSADYNINSVKIKQIGSLSTSYINNIRLYYKNEDVCSEVKPSDSTLFGTFNNFDSGNTAVVSGSMSISAGSKFCLYIVYDLNAPTDISSMGQGIDFEITNPSVDITGGVVGTINKVNISGQTIIIIPSTPNPNPGEPKPDACTNSEVTSVISLRMENPLKNPTLFYLQNCAIWKKEGTDSPVRMTDVTLQVQSLRFVNNGQGMIRIEMETSNMDPNKEGTFLQTSKSSKATASIRTWDPNNQ